jgi:hypothetical protein
MDDIRELVELCGSFLILRKKAVYFVHQSAKEYLNKSDIIFPQRCTKEQSAIVSRSLQCISDTLGRDMYDLRNLGCLIEQVECPIPDPLVRIRYACVYWVDHLCEIHDNLQSRVDFIWVMHREMAIGVRRVRPGIRNPTVASHYP